MLEKLNHDDLLRLTSIKDGPCISIYIPSMLEKTMNIEYQALVRRAIYLLSFDPRNDLRNDLVEKLNAFNPYDHMTSLDQGLAIFVNRNWANYFVSRHELPSKVVVAESFHLKPILDDLQGVQVCHALVISADEALLIHCDNGVGTELHTFLFRQGKNSNSIHWKHLDESETAQIPHLKVHLRGRGQEDSQFKRKAGVKLFLKWIESKINKESKYKEQPLYVFTNEILFNAYREISSHPHPVFSRIELSKGIPRLEALLHQVRLLLQKNLGQQKELSSISIDELKQQKRMVDDLANISKAALNGRIKTLFLRDNIDVWGQFHRDSGQITFHEKQQDSKDDDILDDIACEVIRKGGEVIVLNEKDMPSNSPAAAILTTL
ncbi:MAG: baeRF3 domain-containing protein [Pseudobdellovibrionaceae bacterium]